MSEADNRKKYLKIGELISRFELSNTAEGKSPKTVLWYSEMLSVFIKYLKVKRLRQDLPSFTTELVRGYILYLKAKPKYEGHPYIPKQDKPLSPKTIQCHVRALKAFSSWLYHSDDTTPQELEDFFLLVESQLPFKPPAQILTSKKVSVNIS